MIESVIYPSMRILLATMLVACLLAVMLIRLIVREGAALAAPVLIRLRRLLLR